MARLHMLETQLSETKSALRKEINDEAADLRKGLQEAIRLLQEVASRSRY